MRIDFYKIKYTDSIMSQIEKDVLWGKKKEAIVFPLLQSKFPDVSQTEDQFDCFDFRDDVNKIDFELKSRNMIKGKFNTIFFGWNKLLEGRARRESGYSNRTIYLFRFQNRADKRKHVIYFWEDDMEIPLDKMPFQFCGNFKRGEEAQKLVNLPQLWLKPFRELVYEETRCGVENNNSGV